MLDMKAIRDEYEKIENALKTRGGNKEIHLKALVALDEKKRKLAYDADQKKAVQNQVSKQIPQYKKEGKDTAEIFAQMKTLSDEIKELDVQIRALDEEIMATLYEIPNTPNEQVPIGKDSDENIEVRKSETMPKSFEYEPKAHWELGENLQLFNAEIGAKVSGARFTFYTGLGARLERAIFNFFLDTHTYNNGYKEIFPPFMVNADSMRGTGQLPKFAEDMFKIENTDYYMIPTAEVPITNMHRDEILDAAQLPIKYCAYSACFRAEAGSAGRDTRGLIRQHQFNKVELVQFVEPEKSYEALESLTRDAESVLALLKLPYRVVRLCTGDLGFSSAMTYDIEVWMPSYGRYVEISSCSNFEGFQARRASIRYKENPKDKAKMVHTLNGSGVAVGRTVAAILENYQNDDGSITIPDVLVPYMGGLTEIK